MILPFLFSRTGVAVAAVLGVGLLLGVQQVRVSWFESKAQAAQARYEGEAVRSTRLAVALEGVTADLRVAAGANQALATALEEQAEAVKGLQEAAREAQAERDARVAALKAALKVRRQAQAQVPSGHESLNRWMKDTFP